MTHSAAELTFVPPPKARPSLGADFTRSLAVVIGINDYSNGIQPLRTPVSDACALAHLLRCEHGYDTLLLTTNVTKARLRHLFAEYLPSEVTNKDRMLVYFAGHGALDDEDLMCGYLVPQDAQKLANTGLPPQEARRAELESLLPMSDLVDWLDQLACRHMLLILDSCFAGAIRWPAVRHLVAVEPRPYQQRYRRYLESRAWQVLTSAAYNQEAVDVAAGFALGQRDLFAAPVHPENPSSTELHSPFAIALLDSLQGKADHWNDGVITATALYLEIRNCLEAGALQTGTGRQTPGIWPLKRHEHGEYVFLVPGREPKLVQDPKLDEANNPYRGLQPYSEEHRLLFFGRRDEITQLSKTVEDCQLTVVTGVSGAGKSSLVSAGLLPHLRHDPNHCWEIVGPLRPTEAPLNALEQAVRSIGELYSSDTKPTTGFAKAVADWHRVNLGKMLVVAIDQLEELVTLATEEDRQLFISELCKSIDLANGSVRIIVTVRADFEPCFDQDPLLRQYWQDGRYQLPPLTAEDLRQVVEKPAEERAFYYESSTLVDELVNAVLPSPSSLSLLSFTLSELYRRYVDSGRMDRTVTWEDYKEIGGVAGALYTRAEQEYLALSAEEQKTMRRIMLRMIASDGSDLARRRVRRSELEYLSTAQNEQVHKVLERLIAARLLIAGTDGARRATNASKQVDHFAYVEPAHDMLIIAWRRLRDWRTEAAGYLSLQREVYRQAVYWHEAHGERNKRAQLWANDARLPQLHRVLAPQDYGSHGWLGLFQAVRRTFLPSLSFAAQVPKPAPAIQAALAVAAAQPQVDAWLNALETDFVRACVRHRAGDLWRGIGLAAAVLVLFAGVAWYGQREVALQQQRTLAAESGRFANLALRELAIDPAGAVQIALSALPSDLVDRPYVADAEYALTEALQRNQLVWRFDIRTHGPSAVAIGPHEIAVGGETITLLPRNVPLPHSILTGGNGVRAPEAVRLLKLESPAHVETTTVLWSPRGDLLSHDDHTAAVWRNHELLATHSFSDTAAISCAAWSPDGQRIAFCIDHDVWLYAPDDDDAQLLFTFPGFVSHLAWAPRGDQVAVAVGDNELYLQPLAGVPTSIQGHRHANQVLGMSFLEDGRLLTWGEDGTVRLWSDQGRWQNTLAPSQPSPSSVRAVVPEPGGKRLAALHVDGVIDIWSQEKLHAPVLTLDGGDGQGVTAAAWQHDYLATGGTDRVIRIWDLATGLPVTQLLGHSDRIHALAWQSDRQHLLSYGADGSLRIWRVLDSTGEPVCEQTSTEEPRCRTLLSASASISQSLTDAQWVSGGQVLIATAAGQLLEWAPGNADLKQRIALDRPSSQIAVDKRGEQALVYVPYASGMLWERRNGEWVQLESVLGPIASAQWSSDRLLLLRGDGRIELHGSTTEVDTLDVRLSPSPASISLIGQQLAVSEPDGSLRVYLFRGQALDLLAPGTYDPLVQLQWSSDGSHLLGFHQYLGTPRMWSMIDGAEVLTTTLLADDESTVALAWQPQGDLCAVATNRVLRLVDRRTGEVIAANDLADSPLLGLTWAPGGKRLASWHSDGVVRVWYVDAPNRSLTPILRIIVGGKLAEVEFSPDQHRLLVVGSGSELSVWQAWPELASLLRAANSCCIFP